MLVEMRAGAVSAARNVWVEAPAATADADGGAVADALAAAAATPAAAGPEVEGGQPPAPPPGPIILDQEELIKTAAAADGSGRVVCSFFQAYTAEWAPVVLSPLQAGAAAGRG